MFGLAFRAMAGSAIIVACVAACADSSAPGAGTIRQLQVQSGDGQEAFAGAAVSQPIVVVPVDANGRNVTGQSATFMVSAGDGTLASSTAHAAADGAITMPSWPLGRSNTPQTVDVAVGTVTTTVRALVRSDLKIDMRFFGETLTPAQQAIFTDAAARLRAVIVGSMPVVDLSGIGAAPCGVSELPAPTGTTDAIVIYAGAKFVDGINGLLGVGDLCYSRSATDARASIGVIVLDLADINYAPGDMRVVALHEMLHVLGFGSWNERQLLTGFNTSSVAYVGPGGIAGCRAVGGLRTCASSVPVQNIGGSGEANSHWRDAVFGEELMTAAFKARPVLSVMTIRSLEDLGYVVNPLAADPYTIPADNPGARAAIRVRDAGWESHTAVRAKVPPVGDVIRR